MHASNCSFFGATAVVLLECNVAAYRSAELLRVPNCCVIFLAFEISRQDKDSLTYRYPLIVSFGFGLLHGLGFASALGEIGLVQNEILASLLFFNLGVEAGQVAFILVFCIALWILGKAISGKALFAEVTTAQRADMLAAYVIGIPSSYWLIERVTSFVL